MSQASRARVRTFRDGRTEMVIDNPLQLVCPTCGLETGAPIATTKIADGCYTLLPGDGHPSPMTLHLKSGIDAMITNLTAIRIDSAKVDPTVAIVRPSTGLNRDMGILESFRAEPQ